MIMLNVFICLYTRNVQIVLSGGKWGFITELFEGSVMLLLSTRGPSVNTEPDVSFPVKVTYN